MKKRITILIVFSIATYNISAAQKVIQQKSVTKLLLKNAGLALTALVGAIVVGYGSKAAYDRLKKKEEESPESVNREDILKKAQEDIDRMLKEAQEAKTLEKDPQQNTVNLSKAISQVLAKKSNQDYVIAGSKIINILFLYSANVSNAVYDRQKKQKTGLSRLDPYINRIGNEDAPHVLVDIWIKYPQSVVEFIGSWLGELIPDAALELNTRQVNEVIKEIKNIKVNE